MSGVSLYGDKIPSSVPLPLVPNSSTFQTLNISPTSNTPRHQTFEPQALNPRHQSHLQHPQAPSCLPSALRPSRGEGRRQAHNLHLPAQMRSARFHIFATKVFLPEWDRSDRNTLALQPTATPRKKTIFSWRTHIPTISPCVQT